MIILKTYVIYIYNIKLIEINLYKYFTNLNNREYGKEYPIECFYHLYAYNIPNIWLDQYKLPEGDFKFKDYFLSQKREYVKINSIDEYSDKKLYLKGNQINLTTLINSFPFSKL